MTRNDIIRMALEAGFGCDTDGHIFTYNQDGICDEYLERFADLVAALEREACADEVTDMGNKGWDCYHAAEAIRARRDKQ